jgi:hypothetical protein
VIRQLIVRPISGDLHPQVPGGVAYLLEIEGKNTIGLTVARAHFNVGARWTPGLRWYEPRTLV